MILILNFIFNLSYLTQANQFTYHELYENQQKVLEQVVSKNWSKGWKLNYDLAEKSNTGSVALKISENLARFLLANVTDNDLKNLNETLPEELIRVDVAEEIVVGSHTKVFISVKVVDRFSDFEKIEVRQVNGDVVLDSLLLDVMTERDSEGNNRRSMRKEISSFQIRPGYYVFRLKKTNGQRHEIPIYALGFNDSLESVRLTLPANQSKLKTGLPLLVQWAGFKSQNFDPKREKQELTKILKKVVNNQMQTISITSDLALSSKRKFSEDWTDLLQGVGRYKAEITFYEYYPFGKINFGRKYTAGNEFTIE